MVVLGLYQLSGVKDLTDIPATIDLNPPGGDPEASVLWLHGLGADGNDFVPIVDRFLSLSHRKVRFVFPHAPVRAITVNGGMQMRAWYDIVERDFSREEDLAGIHHSEALMHQLLEREHHLGIPYHRIVIGGF